MIWVMVAVIAALCGAWLARELHRSEPRLASGTWLPQPREIGDFRLTDHAGRPFTRASLPGAPTLVFFGFTHCPDVCPTTLSTLARVKNAASLDSLRVVLISVDPERDTPEVLGKYVRAFDAAFIGATGSQEEISQLTKEFGVAVQRVDMPNGAGYTVDHSAAVFLLDANGHITGVFTPPFDASAMAADLQRSAWALERR
jgi:protein SCO1